MREEELREKSTCIVCKKGIGHTRLPLFWRVRMVRYGLHLDRIQRQDGLAAALGGHSVLARVMGPDQELTQVITDREVTVCETCVLEVRLAHLIELAGEEEEDPGREDSRSD